MGNYIICVRSIKNKKFSNEPGKTYFLDVPHDNEEIEVEHRVAVRANWFKMVMKESVIETDEEGNEIGDILVFIHGYNNSQTTVLARHKEIKKSLKAEGYEGAVVSFDWPSAEHALNYLEDRSDAKFTAIKLVDDCIKVFSAMQNEKCRINIHLLAHSTGAYVIREAFDDADDRPRVAAHNWTVSQVMFIGGDISAKSMTEGNGKTSSLYRHCIRLTNYSNPFDDILKLSNVKRIGVAPRVGRVGLPKTIPENAVNVNCGKYYEENEVSIVALIGSKSHSWHIGNKAFTKDLLLTIAGDIDRHSIPTREIIDDALYLKK